MTISGFDKEHTWPATFQLNLSGVGTVSGSASAGGVMGSGSLAGGVATGDTAPIGLYVTLLGIAAAAVVFTERKRRNSR